jgi:hypothetical protein
LPNIALAVATNNDATVFCGNLFLDKQLEVTTVAVSSSAYDDLLSWVGSKELKVAETKLLHLFANNKISAPHR